jgi:LacI family transcriptional regulator
MDKKVSIGDIAKQLNVSITTVSFILNGKAEEKRISTALAKKVTKLAQELGYVPNQLAKSLRTGKTNIIGLIVEDIANPFFANVARLIEENANKRGYKIFYCSSENDTEKTKQLIKVFKERQVDGYIITPSPNIENDIKDLLNNHSKVVLFDRYLPKLKSSYVIADNFEGSYNAVRHLIDQGYKKIGFITLNSEQTQMKQRCMGYQKAIEEEGMKSYVKKIRFHENSELMVRQIIDLLNSSQKPDALFFATNYLGISGLEAIKRMKLKIPEDIAVVSFDDHDIFRLYTPTITAVAQPIEEMSKTIINLLLKQLENGKPDPIESHKLKTKLIIRQSSVLSGIPVS